MHRLHVGSDYIKNVPPEVCNYEASGKQTLTQWFSYRKPRDIQPDR